MGNLEDKVKKQKEKIPADLTLKDVVDILSDGYRVETLRFVSNYSSKSTLYGIHLDGYGQKEILINSDLPVEDRRETIIHEFYHALFARIGRKQDEKEVESLAVKKYKELYE